MTDGDKVIDQRLLQAAREGDETAWRTLADRLYPTVAGIIRNHLRRIDDHEDVVQEVFIKIFTKLGQFTARQPFEHWVSRITLNTCTDWLRRIKARPLTSYSDLSEPQREIIERGQADPAGETDSRLLQLREFLNHLIDGLKPREQIVIRLLDLEECSVQDVCDRTGWGASKVKVTAMRARRKLAERLRRLRESDSSHPD